MDQNSNKSAMQNGLIVGAMISLSFLLKNSNNTFFIFISLFLSFYSIYFLYACTKKYRDTKMNNSITYYQAFKFVFKVYFYGCFLESIIILAYVNIFPEFLPTLMNKILNYYDRINPKIVELYYDSIVIYFKPNVFPIFNLFGSTILATLLGLILALFLKKEKSIFEE